MAKAVKKPTIAKKPRVKPDRMKADRMRPKPAPKPAPLMVVETMETVEQVMAGVVLLCDEVDKVMATDPDGFMAFNGWGRHLTHLRDFRSQLINRLDELLDPDETKQDITLGTVMIERALECEPGVPGPWSRPSTFLLWIDYVPVLCSWGGFMQNVSVVWAASPSTPWMAPSGTASGPIQIRAVWASVHAMFRGFLEETARAVDTDYRRTGPKRITPRFHLFPLNDKAKAVAVELLADPANAWLVAALKRGPVDPIPLPAHLQAVQITLFDL